jgi:hypothetical protein
MTKQTVRAVTTMIYIFKSLLLLLLPPALTSNFSSFSPQGVYNCFVRRNKEELFHYRWLRHWSVKWKMNARSEVFAAMLMKNLGLLLCYTVWTGKWLPPYSWPSRFWLLDCDDGPVPVTVLSKEWAFGRALAGIVGSNLTGVWMFVSCVCVCCQVEVSATDLSLVQKSLPGCVCVWVWSRNLQKRRPRPDLGCRTTGKEDTVIMKTPCSSKTSTPTYLRRRIGSFTLYVFTVR